MSFADYWLKKQKANPKILQADKITQPVEAFRVELEKAFLAGKAEGRYEANSMDKRSIFEKVFGK